MVKFYRVDLVRDFIYFKILTVNLILGTLFICNQQTILLYQYSYGQINRKNISDNNQYINKLKTKQEVQKLKTTPFFYLVVSAVLHWFLRRIHVINQQKDKPITHKRIIITFILIQCVRGFKNISENFKVFMDCYCYLKIYSTLHFLSSIYSIFLKINKTTFPTKDHSARHVSSIGSIKVPNVLPAASVSKDTIIIAHFFVKRRNILVFYVFWLFSIMISFYIFSYAFQPGSDSSTDLLYFSCIDLSFQQFYNEQLLQRLNINLKKVQPSEMIQPIKQTSNLSEIYPNISEQLCNKHAKLLSQLKIRFTQIYDDFQPEKYIIVNGVAKIVDLGNDLQLNFAMENGVTVLFRKTYLNQDIYINGNHLEEEIIFNSKGKHIEGICQKVDQIRDLIQMIRKNSSKEKEYFGGIIYVHSNIGENIFSFQECFMLATFVALLMLHEEIEKYNRCDLVNSLGQIDNSLCLKTLTNLLENYNINKCNIQFNNRILYQSQNELDLNICDPQSDKSIKTHQSNESIKIVSEFTSFKSTNSKKMKPRASTQTKTSNSNHSISSLQQSQSITQRVSSLKLHLQTCNKLVMCQLDLSNQQFQNYQNKINRIKEINQLIQQEKLNKFDIFQQNENYLRNSAFKDMVKQEEYQLLRYCDQNRFLLNNLINHKIQFAEFIVQKHDLDIKYEIFDQQIVQLINQIHKEAPFLKNFCIIEGTVLLISIDKQYYAQIMRFLRKLFNDYKLSTYRYLQTKHKLNEQKVSEIGQIMFTTSPSLGCAIYNPAQSIWM